MNVLHVTRQLEALAKLQRALKSGEHTGAGLSLTLQVGGGDGPATRTQFTLSVETEDVLEALTHSLRETLNLSRILGKSSIRDTSEALKSIDAALED